MIFRSTRSRKIRKVEQAPFNTCPADFNSILWRTAWGEKCTGEIKKRPTQDANRWNIFLENQLTYSAELNRCKIQLRRSGKESFELLRQKCSVERHTIFFLNRKQAISLTNADSNLADVKQVGEPIMNTIIGENIGIWGFLYHYFTASTGTRYERFLFTWVKIILLARIDQILDTQSQMEPLARIFTFGILWEKLISIHLRHIVTLGSYPVQPTWGVTRNAASFVVQWNIYWRSIRWTLPSMNHKQSTWG